MFHKREIRCRNFDDDGEPINRGCRRGTDCPFVHPDNPAWVRASRRQNSDVNSNQSRPPHSPGNTGRNSWGNPPTKTASKDWDPSLWESPSRKTDNISTARKWGSQSSASKDATAASPTSSVSNDWNMTSDKGETSKSGTEEGWGSTDPTGGWGVDRSVGWGSTDSTGGWGVDRSVGWGGSGGWGEWGSGANKESASAGEGWGGGKAVDEASTAPNGNDQKGKGKERQREDVEMKDPSPPKAVSSLKSINLGQDTHESTPAPPPVRNTPPPSSVASKPARPIPLPLPSRQKKAPLFEDGDLTKLALQSVKNKEAKQVQEKQIPLPARGPKGRADLFSQVIKNTSTVVLLQVELQHAQRDLGRWKRTQESSQYERASPATRVILDRHRVELNLRVQEAKRRLDRALTALIDLPDFASRNRKTPGPILTKQTIAAYTAELRDWFSDLELHKRILMEKAAAQTDLSPASIQDSPVEPRLTARQLVERGNWSWNDIKTATNELDTRVLTTAEHLYSDVYTTIADLKDQAISLQDPHPINTSATARNQFDAVSSTANLVGDNLSAQAIRAAELISRIHALEQERDHLENETRAMNKLCAEAEVHFSHFEQWRQDDRAKIQEMAEQLRTLHLRHKSPKTTTATLQPAQLDNILLQMRPVITDRLQKEVQPVFDALRSRCLENHEGMKSLIEELVTPALVMTDDIRHRVSALSFDETLK